MAHEDSETTSNMLATLLAAGWEPFEGEPGEGFMVAEGPNGERLRLRIMDNERLRRMVERWERQLAEEAALTPYQKRKRREAWNREVARDREMRAAWRATRTIVRRQAFKAIREGRASNVLLFTPNAKGRYAGVPR